MQDYLHEQRDWLTVERLPGYAPDLNPVAALYEAQHRQLQIKHLKWKAATLGYQLIQVPAA